MRAADHADIIAKGDQDVIGLIVREATASNRGPTGDLDIRSVRRVPAEVRNRYTCRNLCVADTEEILPAAANPVPVR